MIKFIILVFIGFYLLIKGSDLFVDGISSFAHNIKIPKLIVSLTVVAFGTSTPELFISFKSLLNGNNDIVMANVVGSTIVNTLLVIGVAAMVKSMRIKSETVKKQLPLHLLLITIFAILFLDGPFNGTENAISRSDALIMFLLFGYFVYYTYKYAKEQQSKNIFKAFLEKEKPKWNLSKSIFYSLLGLAFIAIGSELAVNNCVNIAEAMHVSQKIITMVILVVGTSTPELIMAVTAVKKDEFDIIIGNIVGTNIFNIGFVLTLPVLIFGGFSTPSFNSYDMIIMIIAGLLIYIFAKDDKKIDKTEGLIMITIFIIYYAYLIMI